MQIQLNFEQSEQVKIIPFNIYGSIDAIFIKYGQVKYLVRYFMNGELNEEYFYEHELLRTGEKKNEQMGKESPI